MKEIKFRARDREERNFIYFNATKGLLSECDETYARRNVGKIEQYTGRKDKNGKDIYAGELIEYPETSFPLEVIWDEWRCGFNLRSTKNGAVIPMPSRETMAKYGLSIGNIYENKD